MSIVDHAFRRLQESDDPEGLCVTIEAKANSDNWIQLKDVYINFAYPFSEEPTETVNRLGIVVPPDVDLDEWDANTFATFWHAFEDVASTAEFVRQYMGAALNLADDENAVKVKEEFL